MNWFKNFILKLLRIEPARDKKIVIKEPMSFRANVLKNKILYRGDPAEIEQFFKAIAQYDVEKTRFWASVSQGSVRKMHSGIVGIVIDRYKDIITADFEKIEFGEKSDKKPIKDLWDEIAKDNDFLDIIEEAIIGALSSGDGAFKINIDPESIYPRIEFFDADDVDFVRKSGKLKEIKYYTTYSSGSKEYRLEETYGCGYVKYKLFDEEGHEAKLSALKETEELKDAAYDMDFIMGCPYMVHKSSKYKGRGKALFDLKTDVIDALDEVISQWLDAVRLGRIKRYIPENLIPRNPENGELMPANPFDNDFIAIGDDMGEGKKSQIDISQPQIAYEAYLNSYISFMDMVLQGVISPASLGIDLKKTDNSESQREKEKVTMEVRSKIVDALTKTIPGFVECVMMVNDIMNEKKAGEYKASIKFGEYASPDFDSTVETVGKAKSYGVMSIETSVEQMYGDTWTDEEKKAEVERIKAEQGIAVVNDPAVNIEGVVIDESKSNEPPVPDEQGKV